MQAAALSGTAFAWAKSPPSSGFQVPNETLAKTCRSLKTYQITDLGVLMPTAINSDAGVVGQFAPPAHPFQVHAFLWKKGHTTDLGTLVSGSIDNTQALAINDHDQVVGSSSNGTEIHAFLWQHGRMMDLGSLLSTNIQSQATDINNKTQVVGTSAASAGDRAFLWESGHLTDLSVSLGIEGLVSAINDKGWLAGFQPISVPNGPSMDHAFLWHDGQAIDLGTLGEGFSDALDLNNNGQVVGVSGTTGGTHAFLWKSGQITDLGTLGGSRSSASAINDEGQIIGDSDTVDGQHAFLWENGHMADLNALVPASSGWVLTGASAINGSGQIVGTGQRAGQQSGFLLTPTCTVDASLQLSFPSWQFAAHPIGQTSGPAPIWIYNSGPEMADFNAFQFTGANPRDFAIGENTCGSALAPFATCKVVFHFTPSAAGERSASLTLNDDAKDGPHAIPVQGLGSSK